DDDVRRVEGGGVEGRLPAPRRGHLVALAAEVGPDVDQDARLVVHHQDAARPPAHPRLCLAGVAWGTAPTGRAAGSAAGGAAGGGRGAGRGGGRGGGPRPPRGG